MFLLTKDTLRNPAGSLDSVILLIRGFLSRFHTLLCNSGFPDGLQHLLTDVGIEGSEKLAVILT